MVRVVVLWLGGHWNNLYSGLLIVRPFLGPCAQWEFSASDCLQCLIDTLRPKVERRINEVNLYPGFILVVETSDIDSSNRKVPTIVNLFHYYINLYGQDSFSYFSNLYGQYFGFTSMVTFSNLSIWAQKNWRARVCLLEDNAWTNQF